MPDLEFAHTVLVVGCEPLDDAPILDLRIRKGVRRNGVKLAIASARPSALDSNATLHRRATPPAEEQLPGRAGRRARRRRPRPPRRGRAIGQLADQLRDGGEDVVIVCSERIGARGGGPLLRIAERLELADYAGAGLLEIPAGANGRGLREAGVVPDAGPGYAELAGRCRAAAPPRIARAAAAGELTALYLFRPTRSATCPTAPCGSARCTAPRWSSPTPRC